MTSSQQVSKAIALLIYTTILLYTYALFYCTAKADPLRSNHQFARYGLSATMYLDNLGVADINDDGWLDIYTTNHQARPLILINQLDGTFSNDVIRLGLGTAQGVPGQRSIFSESDPHFDKPGLYIY